MRRSWTQGLEKELTVDVRQNFKESLVMRRRLLELISEKIRTSQRSLHSKTLYENPNWVYLQADARGYERALHEISELLSDASVD
jgi:hypothetical protein